VFSLSRQELGSRIEGHMSIYGNNPCVCVSRQELTQGQAELRELREIHGVDPGIMVRELQEEVAQLTKQLQGARMINLQLAETPAAHVGGYNTPHYPGGIPAPRSPPRATSPVHFASLPSARMPQSPPPRSPPSPSRVLHPVHRRRSYTDLSDARISQILRHHDPHTAAGEILRAVEGHAARPAPLDVPLPLRGSVVAWGGPASPVRMESNPVWGTRSPYGGPRESPARAYAQDLANLALKVGMHAENAANPAPSRYAAGAAGNQVSEAHEELIARLLKKHGSPTHHRQ